jgi:hypothetical protein
MEPIGLLVLGLMSASIYISYPLLIFLHELIHVLFSRIFGYEVKRTVLGTADGKVLYEKQTKNLGKFTIHNTVFSKGSGYMQVRIGEHDYMRNIVITLAPLLLLHLPIAFGFPLLLLVAGAGTLGLLPMLILVMLLGLWAANCTLILGCDSDCRDAMNTWYSYSTGGDRNER